MREGLALLSMFTRPVRPTLIFLIGSLLLLVLFVPVLRNVDVSLRLALAMPPVMQSFVLIAQIGFPKSDLLASGSGYPDYFLRLPMRSRSLALWPILAVVVWSIGCGLMVCYGYCQRIGIAMNSVTAIGIVVCTTTTMLAIAWYPFRVGGVRFLSISIALLTIIGLACYWLLASTWPIHVLDGILMGLSGLAVTGSCHAVRLARAPRTRKQSISLPTLKRKSKTNVPQFRSMWSAQLWMESKLRGKYLPLTVAVLSMLMSGPLVFMAAWPVEILPGVLANGWLPMGLPFLLSAVFIITCFLRVDAKTGQQDLSSFFTSLPITNAQMMASKRREQGVSLAAAWAITLFTAGLWLMLPADVGTKHGPLLTFLPHLVTFRTGCAAALAFLVITALSWRNYTIWTFAGLFANPIQKQSMSIATMALPTLAVPFGLAIWESHPPLADVLRYLPLLITVLLGLKLAAAYRIWAQMRRLSAREARDLQQIFCAWVVAAMICWWVVSTFFALIPKSSTATIPNLAITIPLGVLLLVPLARPMLARLMLHNARHG